MLEIPAKRKFSASLVNNQDRFYSNLFKNSVGTEKKEWEKSKSSDEYSKMSSIDIHKFLLFITSKKI